MKLTNTEQEPIINFNVSKRTASIFTRNPALKTRLWELCRYYPAQVRQTADNRRGGVTFELPQEWVKASPSYVLPPT